MKHETTGTIRTAINSTLAIWIAGLVYKFTGVEIPIEYVIIGAPVGIGIFYRLSLSISERFPKIGYVLFGYNKPPFYE